MKGSGKSAVDGPFDRNVPVALSNKSQFSFDGKSSPLCTSVRHQYSFARYIVEMRPNRASDVLMWYVE